MQSRDNTNLEYTVQELKDSLIANFYRMIQGEAVAEGEVADGISSYSVLKAEMRTKDKAKDVKLIAALLSLSDTDIDLVWANMPTKVSLLLRPFYCLKVIDHNIAKNLRPIFIKSAESVVKELIEEHGEEFKDLIQGNEVDFTDHELMVSLLEKIPADKGIDVLISKIMSLTGKELIPRALQNKLLGTQKVHELISGWLFPYFPEYFMNNDKGSWTTTYALKDEFKDKPSAILAAILSMEDSKRKSFWTWLPTKSWLLGATVRAAFGKKSFVEVVNEKRAEICEELVKKMQECFPSSPDSPDFSDLIVDGKLDITKHQRLEEFFDALIAKGIAEGIESMDAEIKKADEILLPTKIAVIKSEQAAREAEAKAIEEAKKEAEQAELDAEEAKRKAEESHQKVEAAKKMLAKAKKDVEAAKEKTSKEVVSEAKKETGEAKEETPKKKMLTKSKKGKRRKARANGNHPDYTEDPLLEEVAKMDNVEAKEFIKQKDTVLALEEVMRELKKAEAEEAKRAKEQAEAEEAERILKEKAQRLEEEAAEKERISAEARRQAEVQEVEGQRVINEAKRAKEEYDNSLKGRVCNGLQGIWNSICAHPIITTGLVLATAAAALVYFKPDVVKVLVSDKTINDMLAALEGVSKSVGLSK